MNARQERIARVVIACGWTDMAEDDTAQRWDDWLDALLELDLDADLELVASARDVRQSIIAWDPDWARGDRVGALIAEALDEAERDRFYGHLAALRRGGAHAVAALGGALTQTPDGFGASWALRGALDVDLLETLGAPGEALSEIAEALALSRVAACEVGLGGVEALFELGRRPAGEVVEGLFGGLGLVVPRGIVALAEASVEPCQVLVRARDEGGFDGAAVRLVPGAGDGLVRVLAACGIGREHDERIAALQGSLDVTQPTWAQAWLDGESIVHRSAAQMNVGTIGDAGQSPAASDVAIGYVVA